MIAPINLSAQTCDGASADPEIVGGIVCPDGAEATVIPSNMPLADPAVLQDPPDPTSPDEEFIPDLSATVDAPIEAASGSRFFVEWTGPDNQGDYIAIAEPGTNGNQYRNYTYAQQGSPLSLTAPDEAGEYEVRYIQNKSRSILASVPIRVTPASATLAAAGEVSSGAAFDVNWTGPDNQGDYIAIAEPGTNGNQYRNYTYAQQGSPLSLTAPDEAGDYEVRYIQHQSRSILANIPIRVTPASATLAAASEVSSGAAFDVIWTGPDNQGDYIAIAEPGTNGNQYRNYTYVRQVSPLSLTAPDEPGDYEVRYIQHQSRSIIATMPIKVLPVTAVLEVPATASAGEKFDVNWTGPANPGDYIVIAGTEGSASEYDNYQYTQRGSPLQLTAPDQTGSYEVRYIQQQSRTILTRQAIRIVE